jgi:ABC-2 type transport system permease protein
MSTTSTPVWRIVAEREIGTRLRDKTFLGATAMSVLFVVGFFVITSVVGSGSDEFDVTVVTPDEERIARSAEPVLRASGTPDAEITVRRVDSTSAAEAEVRDGDADVALLAAGDGFTLVGDDDVDPALGAALTSAVAEDVLQANADAQGVDLDALAQGSEVEQRLLDPNAVDSDARSGVAFAFALVFFMTALGFGMTIAQSVAREKESRVVEILAAAVPIRALLWGKIIGNTLLALGQVLLMVVVGLVGLAVTGRRELLSGIGWAVVAYIAFFVLGFLALAALWSVAGALASRQEDLQSTTLPGQMILLIPYFVSVLASEKVQTVVSMLPIASTMVMPGRMAKGDVPWWQVGVGIALTVLAAVVFVRIGSRLYERTLLRTGGKIGYREAFRLTA